MERNFTNENFENFLRQNADGLRMRPSEKVWKQISKKLGRRKRVAGFTIGSILLAICTLGYFSIEPGKALVPVKTSGTGTGQDVQTKINNGTQGNQNSTIAETPVVSMTHSPLASIFNAELPLYSSYEDQPFTLLENRNNETPAEQALFQPTITDDNLGYPSQDVSGTETTENSLASIHYPLTKESVFNLKPRMKKKLSFQFYFTPTVSYRKLSENKTFLRSPVVNSQNSPASYSDVNHMVTHKPDMGFEMGMAVKYPLTSKMKLRAGLQFSINRYDIKAYTASTTLATLMLNTTNNGIDSVNTITQYSNIGGVKADWLENLYFQFSAPVGLEFQVAGNDKVNFGIATTIQPTYVSGGKSYLITTDYKSYTEVPDLVRRWVGQPAAR